MTLCPHPTTATVLAAFLGDLTRAPARTDLKARGLAATWSVALQRAPVLAGYPILSGGAAWVEEMAILRALVEMLRPARVLEVGNRRGDSARALVAGGPIELWAIDLDDCAGHLPPGTHFVRGDQTLAATWAALPTFDLVFVDGAHTSEAVEATLDHLLPHLTERAVVAVHDCDGAAVGVTDGEGVENWLERHVNWRSILLTTPCGMAILRRTI